MLNLVGIYDRINARRFIHQNNANAQVQTRLAAEFRTSPPVLVVKQKVLMILKYWSDCGRNNFWTQFAMTGLLIP